MNDQLSGIDEVLRTLSCQEKRRWLTVLEESIWDIEAQLAQVREARAELMKSLQSDLRSAAVLG